MQQALAAPEFADLAARRRAQLAAATELRARRQAVAAWQAAAAEAARASAPNTRGSNGSGTNSRRGSTCWSLPARRRRQAGGRAERHDHARARAGLAAFRAHLAAGEPCPLCGSAEHPQPAEASPSELAAAAAAVAESERELDAAHDAVRTREAQRRANAQQLAAAGIAAAKAAQHEVVRRQAAGARLGAEAASSPELAARELAAAEADHAATEAALAADGERAEQLSEQREALRAAERDAARGRAEAEQQLRERQDAEAAVRVHATALEPAFEGVADWPRRVADLGAEPLAALAAVEARRAAAAARHPELAAAAERAFGAEVSAIASHAAAVQVAEQAMAAARVRATDVAEAARLGADAIECEGIELRELEVAVERARAALQECARLRREHEAVARPMIEEEDAKGALADARAASDEFGRRLADARANLTLDDRVRLARAEIAPRLLRAEADYAIWAALDDLIGHSDGKTFAVFAQALTLDLLLVEANRRLQELAPRYRLQRNGGRDMDFAVLDLDLGGAVRSLQTLSGGETFLVSLALALALATLAAPRTRVETLFLDEGFGTLDAHNLEIALGALDSLQAAGCQIGIISHVDGIAERIGATVHVVPEGAGRSRVEVRTG
ncbi:MAG: SbcC/MukB-like Walker B domain-containing protein [Planctomycetota bacterium]